VAIALLVAILAAVAVSWLTGAPAPSHTLATDGTIIVEN
jgi:hypothetical protein